MMSYVDFKRKAITAVEQEIESIIRLHVKGSQDLQQIYRYHLGLDADEEVRGKRIRPLMVLCSCFVSGGEWKIALPAASAVELLHNFSLLHDDVEDKSQLRHGRPTVWTKWGTSQAINAGDGLFSLVFKAIQQFNGSLTDKTILAIQDVVTNCCLRLIEGQFLDVANEGKKSISVDEYWKIIGGKTASLLGCSMQLGGIVAGLEENKQANLYTLGYKLGQNFQLQDDLLDVWGSEAITGKPSDDLINRKLTLPVLLGLKMSTRFRKWWKKGTSKKDEIGNIIEWLKEDGVYQKMMQIIKEMDEEIDQQYLSLSFLKRDRISLIHDLMNEFRNRKK